ncbi:DUF4367 domain-containing protein [Clostridium botulinum]|uniref:DUF4367 domain-containing protein n=1 Tax=Clostridium botulinum TaxID=1491 RepID=UPI0014001A43|nr:DUF4367 domain-containing protein [Clostridium botulinum]MBY6915697.1 DUF4367 domain-containing protein [Clostridium botulinum]NFO41482.1 DUF4367 domain-containing protein [Clostridium botulinum]NFQ37619.1 DUF4367 domain-containing protein [Clostridium botulinum]
MNRKSDRNKLKQIENLLMNTDIDSSKCEEIIFNRLKYKIETGTIKSDDKEKDDIYMKNKKFKTSRVAILTLAILMCSVSVTYGSEILSSIKARFQVGNTEITQYVSTDETNSTDSSADEMSLEFMQEGYKGKLFDKNGNEALYGEHQEYYNAEGKLITGMGVKDLPNGKHEFIASTDTTDEKMLTLKEIKKIANKDVKLPNYLPQGYSFKEGTTSFEGAGVNAVYENKSEGTIVILASTTKEATNGVATTDSVSETSIDGKKVTLSTNCAFWESNGVSYQLYWNFENSNDGKTPSMDMKEVSKIIESMK